TDVVRTANRGLEVLLDLLRLVVGQIFVLLRRDQTSNRSARREGPVGVPVTLNTRGERPTGRLDNTDALQTVHRRTHDVHETAAVEYLLPTVRHAHRVLTPVRVSRVPLDVHGLRVHREQCVRATPVML